MALSPDDLLPVPANYATPDQLSSVRDYARLLAQGATRDQPITSPWQGARMMADALSGNVLRNRMGQQEMASRQYDNPASLQGPWAQQQQPQQSVPPPTPAPQPSSGGYGGVPSSYVDQIRNQEGYAPRAAWDVKQNTYGYGAKAPYAGASIGRSGAEELLNRDISQAAALVDQVNPRLDQGTRAALADLTFNTGFGWSKSGLGDAVRAGNIPAIKQHLLQYNQVAGRPNQVIANRRQMDAGWIGQPGAQVAQAYPAGSPPQAGTPTAMTGALAQAQPTQMAAGAKPTGGPIEAPSTPQTKSPVGTPGLDPSLYTGRPTISQQDFNKAMVSPWIPETRKQELMGIYLNQKQPLTAESPYGTYLYSPQTGAQHFFGKPIEGEMGGGEGITYKGPMGVYDSEGHIIRPQGFPSFGGKPTVQQPDDNLTTPGPRLDKPQSSILPGTQVASNDPRVGLSSVGSIPPVGANAQPSPTGAPGQTQSGQMTQAQPTQRASQPTQIAQAQPQGLEGIMGGLQQMGLDQKRNKGFIEHDQKSYNDAFDSISAAGRDSTALQSTINLTKRALDKTYTGIGSDIVYDWNRAMSALKLGGDPASAAALETFEKGISESITSMMRAKLQGLGQVRNKEIELMQKASAGRYNTRQANEVVLQVAQKESEQMQGLAQVAQMYGSGYRYVGDGKWKQTQETPTNVGLQQVLQKYVEANPALDNDTIDSMMKTLDEGKKDIPQAPRRVRGQQWGNPVPSGTNIIPDTK